MSKKLSPHAYIYKVEKNQKSFEKMQKICKKPLTKGDVCDIMSLPLPKGFFVVRIFWVQHGSHSATQMGLTVPGAEGGTQTFTLWTSNKFLYGRCR